MSGHTIAVFLAGWFTVLAVLLGTWIAVVETMRRRRWPAPDAEQQIRENVAAEMHQAYEVWSRRPDSATVAFLGAGQIWETCYTIAKGQEPDGW
jgi:hypothetical protein